MHIHREMSTHVHYLPGTHTREQIFSELANAVPQEELYPNQQNESYSTKQKIDQKENETCLFFSKNNFDEYASFDLRILHSYSCTDHIGPCLLLFYLLSMTLIESSFPDTATISNISGVHFQFTVGLGCGIMTYRSAAAALFPRQSATQSTLNCYNIALLKNSNSNWCSSR